MTDPTLSVEMWEARREIDQLQGAVLMLQKENKRLEAFAKAERKAALLEAFNDPWWPTPEQYEKFGFTTGHVAHFKFCMSQRARAEQEGE